MKSLSELFREHGSDKHTGDKVIGHSYGPVYDELFTPLQDKIHSVLELGVLSGASLRAWRDFFPDCRVVGLDINVEPREEWMIEVFKCDATHRDEVDVILGDRRFDLIVDDASHWIEDQIISFEILKPRLRPGAIYVVEDVQWVNVHYRFQQLGFKITDMRTQRNKFDDVLAIYKHPQ